DGPDSDPQAKVAMDSRLLSVSHAVADQSERAPSTLVPGDAASIRVNVQKVDQLINLVGELVITHAMLAQTASSTDPVLNERLVNGMAQLQRNTRDLQEAVMSIRMMP